MKCCMPICCTQMLKIKSTETMNWPDHSPEKQSKKDFKSYVYYVMQRHLQPNYRGDGNNWIASAADEEAIAQNHFLERQC